MTKQDLILSQNRGASVKNFETRVLNLYEQEKNVDAVCNALALMPKEREFIEAYAGLTDKQKAEARYLCNDFDREGLIIKNSMDLIEYVKN